MDNQQFPPQNLPPLGPPPGNSMGIAATVMGVVAIVSSWIPYVNFISLILAIVGLILANKAKNLNAAAGAPAGIATAGLVCSIIGLVLSGIGFATCTVCLTCLGLAGMYGDIPMW